MHGDFFYAVAWAMTGIMALALVRVSITSRVHWGWWLVYAALGPLVLAAFAVTLVLVLSYERWGRAA